MKMWEGTFTDLAGTASAVYHSISQQHIHAARLLGADQKLGVIGYETYFEILDGLIKRSKEHTTGAVEPPPEEVTDDETED